MGSVVFFLCFFCFLNPQQLFAAEEWNHNTYREDSTNRYYVGVSEGKEELNEALEEAYQNAIAEAIRHNFGFLKQDQKSIHSDLFKTSVDERSFMKSANVTVKDVRPARQSVEKSSKGTYLVYREVIYPKESIEREKNRLSLQKQDELPLSDYGISGKAIGEVIIRTIPAQAQIILTRVDGKSSVVGTGDARFKAPLGEYFLNIIKEGFIPYHGRVTLSGSGGKLNITLDPEVGFLNIKVIPPDARVYLNNLSLKERSKLPLLVGQEYILRVEHGDYDTYVESISARLDETIDFSPVLRARPAKLTIITSPSDADVLINGRRVGSTPLKNFSYEAGANTEIIIRKDGHEDISQNINLVPNKHHEPLNFKLKKKREKSNSYTRENSSSFKINFSFLSNNESRHNIIYNPFVVGKNSASFTLVPFQYQYFKYRHLAFGADYRYHLEEEKVSVNGESLNRETVTQIWSLNSTLYLIRNRSFSLGFGPEYTWRKNQIRYLRDNSETRLYTQEAQESAWGYKALMQIGLKERANGHHWGINIDYRSYDIKKPELSFWSFGLYWEF